MGERWFTCERCGGTYRSAWTEEEARAEAVERFGPPVPDQPFGTLCDPCHQKFLAWFNGLTPAEHAMIQSGTRGRR